MDYIQWQLVTDYSEISMPTLLKPSQERSRETRLVLSDWSGVFSDNRKVVYSAAMRIMESHGKPTLEFSEWLRLPHRGPAELFREHGIADNHGFLVEQQYKAKPEEVKFSSGRPTLYSDAKFALGEISRTGIPIVILSSRPAYHVIAEARESGIDGFFSEVVGGVKDRRKGILEVLNRRAVEPQYALYVGDNIYNISTAKEIGVFSVGITTGHHHKSSLQASAPDALVDSLSELTQVIMPMLRKGTDKLNIKNDIYY